MASVLSMEHADGRNGHGQREVAADLSESAGALGRGDGMELTSSAWRATALSYWAAMRSLTSRWRR